VGVVVEHVPVAVGVARFGDDAQAAALGGGEDYELVFTAPDPAAMEAAFAGAGLLAPLRVGRVTDDPAARRLGDGALPLLGWEHVW
jgi:thiamine-monophosphate kinase